MSRPDLLVLDLDGTLLCRAGAISEANRAALVRADQEGLAWIVATGRALSECVHVLRALDYQGPVVAASGSMLVDSQTGRTLDRRSIASEHVASVVTHIQARSASPLLLKDRDQCGCDYVIVGAESMHPVSEWWFEATEATWVGIDHLEEDPHPEHTLRVGAVGSPELFRPMVNNIQEQLGDLVQARHWEGVTSTEYSGEPIHLLEVFHPSADKWTMVQSHCASHGLSVCRTAAVGDGLNDVLLIKQSGLGVAVANADHRVLAVADAVTADHEEDGVAKLVHDLLDGRLGLDVS